MFTQLNTDQLYKKLSFVKKYIGANNAADGSFLDANANISSKNSATLSSEIHKDANIQISRALVCQKLTEKFGEEVSKKYIKQLENHEIYCHDESHPFFPYCASVSLYPFLLSGLKELGGQSEPPKHLESFCGTFINLVFLLSSQFAGAIATVEWLMFFDYFARKTLGNNYLVYHSKYIEDKFQQIVYSLNQPAAARNFQSVFWNISIYDEYYFNGMFKDFVFPDGDRPDYSSISKLQEFFLSWFRKERQKAVLTFPVVTVAMLTENDEPKDKKLVEVCTKEMSEGNSFFIYMSENADSWSSCCRLRSDVTENQFSYTLGAGGVSTGSLRVITLNVNRFIQKSKIPLEDQVDLLHKYLYAHRLVLEDFYQADMLPVYKAGFISMKKQYLTIGVNGVVEAAEFKGIEVSNNKEYNDFIDSFLSVVYIKNKGARSLYGGLWNTEFVPAENLGVKFCNWDKEDGLSVSRDCYNSYFYPVESEKLNAVDKFVLHGKNYIKYLDGGSALHLNLQEHLAPENYKQLFNLAAKTGCNYWCVNVKMTVCNKCEHIDYKTLSFCPKCNSSDVDHATRIIGYLKRVSSYSKDRRIEEKKRFYAQTHPARA